jgi:hypothetical protein
VRAGGGIGHGGVGDGACGRLEVGQGGGDDDGDRDAAVRPELAGADAGLECQRERVVQPLGRGAGVGVGVDHRLFGVGVVASRSSRGTDGFEVGPGLWGQPPRQPAHPVGPLVAQHEAAAVGAVAVIEESVGVERVGDAPAQCGDERRVLCGGVLDQHPFCFVFVGDRYPVGEYVEGFADFADVILADGAGLHGLGQRGQLRW